MLPKNKYKYLSIIFLTIIIALFFVAADFCFGVRQYEVPELASSELPQYIKNIFDWALKFAAAIAVLGLVFGALRLLTSGGDPTRMSEAKKTIISSILGLFLLVSSVLIMGKINPRLPALEVREAGLATIGPRGVYLVSEDGKEKTPCPEAVFDVKEIAEQFKRVFVAPEECPAGTTYVFASYSRLGLQGQGQVQNLTCGGSANIRAGQSFRIFRKIAGVYLYRDTRCKDIFNASLITTSMRAFGKYTKEEVKCLEIFNAGEEKYGFILYEEEDFKGRQGVGGNLSCWPKFAQDVYQNVQLKDYGSIAVFRTNPDWRKAGTEVGFYSGPGYGRGGIVYSNEEMAGTRTYYFKGFEKMYFKYPPGVPENEKERCKSERGGWQPNFGKCPGSVRIAGNYLVHLEAYGYKWFGGPNFIYCELFAWQNPEGDYHPLDRRDVSNASILAQEFIVKFGNKSDEAGDVYIIPVFSF